MKISIPEGSSAVLSLARGWQSRELSNREDIVKFIAYDLVEDIVLASLAISAFTVASEALKLTEKFGVEHGFIMCMSPDCRFIRIKQIVRGKKSSVSMPYCDEGEEIASFHTHPGSVRYMSISDLMVAISRASSNSIGKHVECIGYMRNAERGSEVPLDSERVFIVNKFKEVCMHVYVVRSIQRASRFKEAYDYICRSFCNNCEDVYRLVSDILERGMKYYELMSSGGIKEAMLEKISADSNILRVSNMCYEAYIFRDISQEYGYGLGEMCITTSFMGSSFKEVPSGGKR